MSIRVPPSARARGSISSLRPAGPRPVSRSPDVTDLKHRLQAVGYFDASVWSDRGKIGVWLDDASGIGVNLVRQDGNVTSYDVMIRENVSVARLKNVEAAVLRVVIERQNFARQAKEGRFKGEYSLPRADSEFGALLVVIYPERACALANERLGRGAASKARTALKAVLRSWSGNVLTIESWKDNAKLWDYPGFMDVIDESLWRNMDAGIRDQHRSRAGDQTLEPDAADPAAIAVLGNAGNHAHLCHRCILPPRWARVG